MMKDYIGKILHQDVQILPYEAAGELPLAIKNSYAFYLMTTGGQTALLAEPVEKSPLVSLRRQYHQIKVYTELPCVLYLKNMNYYTRDVFLSEGIPFVWEEHQIYLPFMGTLLQDDKRKPIKNCMQISYLTQKLLLTALYEGWQRVTVTKAANKMNVSKMSITRCFDELEALNVRYLKVRNRARNFTADADKKAMWENIRGILRNPVIASYALKDVPDIELPLSGTAALAQYSMLDEGSCPVLAFTKKELPEIDLSYDRQVPAGGKAGCILQELGYSILFADGKAVDPLTTALCISDDEKNDPRVSMAIDEMLEEYVW